MLLRGSLLLRRHQLSSHLWLGVPAVLRQLHYDRGTCNQAMGSSLWEVGQLSTSVSVAQGRLSWGGVSCSLSQKGKICKPFIFSFSASSPPKFSLPGSCHLREVRILNPYLESPLQGRRNAT